MGTNGRTNRKAEKAFDDYAQKCGEVLIMADRRFDNLAHAGCEVVSLRVRFPENEDGDYLVTVRAVTEEGYRVGFHGAETFQDALTGVLNRLYNGKMKWKEDEYAK